VTGFGPKAQIGSRLFPMLIRLRSDVGTLSLLSKLPSTSLAPFRATSPVFRRPQAFGRGLLPGVPIIPQACHGASEWTQSLPAWRQLHTNGPESRSQEHGNCELTSLSPSSIRSCSRVGPRSGFRGRKLTPGILVEPPFQIHALGRPWQEHGNRWRTVRE
jgi:hypothetical protein